MHPTFYIRLAREEAVARSDLCFRSKVVWGYDPEFMARGSLRVAFGTAELTGCAWSAGSEAKGGTERFVEVGPGVRIRFPPPASQQRTRAAAPQDVDPHRTLETRHAPEMVKH